jgi:hypothetical protein
MSKKLKKERRIFVQTLSSSKVTIFPEIRPPERVASIPYTAISLTTPTMRLALLSDIHDHVWHLRAALAHAQAQDCEQLLCCGDLCSPFVMAELIRGFGGGIHVVFGNNDADLFRITRIALGAGARVQLHGEMGDLPAEQMGGQRFGLVHYDTLAASMGASGLFDVLCFGHNHRLEVRQQGSTLLLNPGPLMGVRPLPQGLEPVPASFLTYDTALRKPEAWQVMPSEGSFRVFPLALPGAGPQSA